MRDRQHRPARVRSASFDADAYTVEVVWTTGASVRRLELWAGEEFDEVLSLQPGAVRLDRLNAGAPFLDTHASDQLANVIGSVVPGSARVSGGKGLATIQLSRAPGVADTVTKLREGVIRNISVGYWTHRSQDQGESPDGTPIRLVTDWEPVEISAVPVPADAGAQVRSAGSGARSARGAKPRDAFREEVAQGAAHWRRAARKAGLPTRAPR